MGFRVEEKLLTLNDLKCSKFIWIPFIFVVKPNIQIAEV